MTGFDRGDLQTRLLWLRSEHPDAEIETELVVAEEDMAVCKATIRTGPAGGATAHGSAVRATAGADYVEIAEDRALARALIAVGFGAVSGEDADEDGSSFAPPIALVSARSLVRDEPQSGEPEESGPRPQPIRQSKPEPEAPPEESDDGADGADVSWNKFWAWARPRGYTTAKELNELLGVDNVLAYTPREVRQMLVKYEMDNPPGGLDE